MSMPLPHVYHQGHDGDTTMALGMQSRRPVSLDTDHGGVASFAFASGDHHIRGHGVMNKEPDGRGLNEVNRVGLLEFRKQLSVQHHPIACSWAAPPRVVLHTLFVASFWGSA